MSKRLLWRPELNRKVRAFMRGEVNEPKALPFKHRRTRWR